MLRISRKVLSPASNQINRFWRCSSSTTSNDVEWKNAKPFDQIPGPTTLGMIRAFLPGGKYHNVNMIDLSNKMNEEYGDIAKFPGMFGQRDIIFNFDPNDVEKVFRHEGKFPKRRGLDTLEYFRGTYRKDWFEKGAGLVQTQGEDWYEFRTKVNQTMMQPKTAKLYIPKVDEVVCELVTKMKKNRSAKSETPENFLDYLNEWALESIALITLDRRLGVMENPESSKVNQIMKDVIRLSFEYDVKPGVWRMFKTKHPGFKNVMNVYEKITGIMKEHAEDAMREIEKMQPTSDHEAGVLEKLMKIDKHVAFVMVLDSLIAGIDTTTTGLVSVLYALAKNPDKQAILREEVLQILPTKSSKLTNQSLNSIPYLRAVVKEGLRIHPPINGNLRATGQDLVVKGYQIPKDTDIFLATNVIPLMEKHFKDSKKFIPERWLKDNNDSKCPHASDSHPFAYLPFGFGPRMCIGRRFAELEIEVLTIRLIREFHLEWHQPDLKFKSFTFNTPADPLRFKIIDTKI